MKGQVANDQGRNREEHEGAEQLDLAPRGAVLGLESSDARFVVGLESSDVRFVVGLESSEFFFRLGG